MTLKILPTRMAMGRKGNMNLELLKSVPVYSLYNPCAQLIYGNFRDTNTKRDEGVS